MRVISQDGRTDIPYENFVFGITKDKFIVAIRDTVARPSEVCQGIVAEYSAKAKAIKAMKMLREAYVGMPIVMQNVDVSEDMVKEFERLKKYGIMVQTKNQTSKVDFINNAVFQFPQDDEIEV